MKTITYVVIKDSACSDCIESVTQQWRKSMLSILSTSFCEFYGTCLCSHTQKTILLRPIHSFTKQIINLKVVDIHGMIFPYIPYKLLPYSLLNKIQVTFKVVPCLILGLFAGFLKVYINFGPMLQGGGWVGGWVSE